MPAMFERGGDGVVATLLTQGPWSPDAQWGGAPCGLLTWAIEQVPTLVPMRIARMTFDMHRVVPLGPMAVDAEVVREGKRLQVVLARILVDGVEVARATGLRLRTGPGGPTTTSDPRLEPVPPPPGPEGLPLRESPRAGTVGFLGGIEVRPVEPDAMEKGAWFRVVVPVVEGAALTPVQRVAAVADFTANMANYLDQTRWSAINPDLTIQLEREPVGEWTGLRARSWYSPDGTGHSRADVFDEAGHLGTVASMSLVDEVRAPYT